MPTVAAWIALAVSVVALALSVLALRRSARRRPGRSKHPVPADLTALRDEVEAMRSDAAEAMRHLAVVRYDAFGDMGGHLSWSMALLDDDGNGVVLTAIHGRSDARTYAKNISEWTCDQQLSPEEEEAISYARPS